MRRVEIEAWALRVADAVKAGQHVEDSRVELKAEWPSDPAKAARRIAGQANAGRGDDLLWVIGLDEASGVKGADTADTASWWAAVQTSFDEHVPRLTDVVVYIDGLTLVALHFSADGAPFIVRNAVYGRPGAGSVEREVPWRDGTAVRSARRSDLLRLLVPRTPSLRLEVLGARVNGKVEKQARPDAQPALEWNAWVNVYVECGLGESVVVPWHRASATFSIPICGYEVDLAHVSITGHSTSGDRVRPPWGPSVSVATIHTGSEQVLIDGPGQMHIACAVGRLPVDRVDSLVGEPAVLRIQWLAVDADQPQVLTIDLPWQDPSRDDLSGKEDRAGWRGRWSTGSD